MLLPPKPCRHAGCGVLVRDGSGYCSKHVQLKQSQRDDRRGTAHQRGYGSQWQKARLGWLMKHPLCVHCEQRGRVTAATVVDHITPHKGDRHLFWDRDNWQSLCKPCHDVKTAKEDGGFGRA